MFYKVSSKRGTRRTTSHRYNEKIKSVYSTAKELGLSKVLCGKRAGMFRKMKILRCKEEGCEKRFYGFEERKKWDTMHQYCQKHYVCKHGKKKPMKYHNISKEDEQRWERYHEALGCTVRKMTEEEKKQFNIT